MAQASISYREPASAGVADEGDSFIAHQSLPSDPSNHVLTLESRRKHGLKGSLVVPALIVIVLSAGLGSLLLAWVRYHQTQGSLSVIWQDGAFLLDEGSKSEGGLTAARLLALTIASASSTTLSYTTPILMGLYAFRIGHSWLKRMRSAEAGDETGLPTPLQYGLLVDLLGATSMMSLFTSTRYLLRGPSKRVKAPSILKQAFAMGVIVFVITHAAAAVDLWLHSVTSSVLQNSVNPLNAPFLYSVAQNTCLPYDSDFSDRVYRCLYQAGGWGQPVGVASLTPGMLVTSNSSDSLQAITLADADDMAVLVPVKIPQLLEFRMTSFGARASCQSVNPLCNVVGEGEPQNCTGFTDFSPAFPVSNDGPTQSEVYIWTSDCANCSFLFASVDNGILEPDIPPINPNIVALQLVWASDSGVDDAYGGPAGSTVVTAYSDAATMLVNCSLGFYNVTLDYSNGNYTLVDEELSNTGLSDGLFGPTRLGHYSTNLMSDIEGRALSDNNTDNVMALFTQDFARLAIGSPAVITDLLTDTLSQSTITQSLLGRYPFWPTILLIALLYIHALVALVIYLWTALITHSHNMSLPERPGEDGSSVSELELAHLRLTSPLALVSTLFPADDESQRLRLSIRQDGLDMFQEATDQARISRIRVGLYEDSESKTVFGVWRRNTRPVEEPEIEKLDMT